MLALRLLCTHFSFALIFLWATLTWSRRSLPIASRDDGAKVNENGKNLLRYLLLFSLSISSSSWSQIAVTFSLKKKKEKKKFYSELLIDRFRNSARKDITRVKELLSSTFNRRNDGGKYPVETEISFLPYRVYRESNGTSEFTRWNGIISGQQIKIGTVEISLIGSRSTPTFRVSIRALRANSFFLFFFLSRHGVETVYVHANESLSDEKYIRLVQRPSGSRQEAVVPASIAQLPIARSTISPHPLSLPPPYFSKSLDVSANSGRVLFFFSLPSNFNSELFFFFFFWREKELHDIYIFKFLFFKKL